MGIVVGEHQSLNLVRQQNLCNYEVPLNTRWHIQDKMALKNKEENFV